MIDTSQDNLAQIICTIATPSHFPLAVCMADSFLAHHPHGKVFILQVGGTEKLAANRSAVTVITASDLNIFGYAKMRRQYNNFELCNALKPFLLQHLLENTEADKICWLDADLFVFANLETEVWRKLDDCAVMLTPHLIEVSAENHYWQDLAILRRGVFNGGFIALRRGEKASAFLRWWCARLVHGGFYNLLEGLNCDQGWLDLAANFDINLEINRHSGMNAAFWNLHERQIVAENGEYHINGKPLLFFHFSGYSPNAPEVLSKNSQEVTFAEYPQLRPFFDTYGEILQQSEKEFAAQISSEETPIIPFQASNSESATANPVSVVIPAYNAARFLHQAIAGVLAQTLRPLEIIVVDDGSTDETPEILASFGNLIKVVRQENAGVAAARNRGIAAANGEFVAFLDADDYFSDPGKLAEQLKLARLADCDIVQSGWTSVNENNEKIVDFEEWKLQPKFDLENWLGLQAVFPGALLVRRAALLAVGGFAEDLAFFEDTDLMLRLLHSGFTAEWLRKSTVVYRQHGQNATHRLEERIAAVATIWDRFFSRANLPPKIKKAENALRHAAFLYLAFFAVKAGDWALVKQILRLAQPFGKYKSGGELIYCLDFFKSCALKFDGREMNLLRLVNSKEWQELMQIQTGIEPAANVSAEKMPPAAVYRNYQATLEASPATGEIEFLSARNPDYIASHQPKIDLCASLRQPMGVHRAGWKFALNSLHPLHLAAGIFVDGGIENSFAFRTTEYPEVYQKGWIGFFHHPPEMPAWFEKDRTPQVVLSSTAFQNALPYCRGVFCFSEQHRQWLAERLAVPVTRLYHPTETPEIKFSPAKYLANPQRRIVQIGHWLRKVHSIYFLPTQLKRTIVHQNFDYVKNYFDAEKAVYDFRVDERTVEKLPFLSNVEYDELLSENIAYLDLHAASVNNAIIECIVRNTPVLVNPLPAVKEYLGEDYPFYFTSRIEAARKSEDVSLVIKTHEFLKNHPIKVKLTAEYFLQSIAASEIYSRLPIRAAMSN